MGAVMRKGVRRAGGPHAAATEPTPSTASRRFGVLRLVELPANGTSRPSSTPCAGSVPPLGRWPSQDDSRKANNLPGYGTVWRRLGSLGMQSGWSATLQTRPGADLLSSFFANARASAKARISSPSPSEAALARSYVGLADTRPDETRSCQATSADSARIGAAEPSVRHDQRPAPETPTHQRCLAVKRPCLAPAT